jgi:hypothetical protein
MAVVAVLVLGASACQGQEPQEDEEPRTLPSGRDLGPLEDVTSALDDPASPDLPDPLVDVDRLVSGGPPADGIPALNDPFLEPAQDVDWLEDGDAVLAVSLNGEDRAYPVRILIWHEIANDRLGDVPVSEGSETTATGVFDPVLDGERLTFETTWGGFTDHQTGSRWNILGQAVDGELEGSALTPVHHVDTFWFAWVAFTPHTEILR